MRVKLASFLFLVGILLIADPMNSTAQQGGGGGPGGGGGKGGKSGFGKGFKNRGVDTGNNPGGGLNPGGGFNPGGSMGGGRNGGNFGGGGGGPGGGRLSPMDPEQAWLMVSS